LSKETNTRASSDKAVQCDPIRRCTVPVQMEVDTLEEWLRSDDVVACASFDSSDGEITKQMSEIVKQSQS